MLHRSSSVSAPAAFDLEHLCDCSGAHHSQKLFKGRLSPEVPFLHSHSPTYDTLTHFLTSILHTYSDQTTTQHKRQTKMRLSIILPAVMASVAIASPVPEEAPAVAPEAIANDAGKSIGSTTTASRAG